MGCAEPGALLAGRYRLRAVIRRGRMGMVWWAEDQLRHQAVAIMALPWPPQPGAVGPESPRGRALRGARAAVGLDHRNIVSVYDVVEDGGWPWMVMEFAPFRFPYRSLAAVVRDEGPLSPLQAARAGLQVLAAVRAAHAAGVLHRDINPGNVFAGPAGRVMLAGFGMVTADADPALALPEALTESPFYMAPERARGQPASPASDLWSLGATLYAAVEGRPPFAGDGPQAVLGAVTGGYPEPPHRLGPLWPLTSALLRKDPGGRQDAAETEWLLRRAASRCAGQPAPPPAEPARLLPGSGPAPGNHLMPRPNVVPSQPAAAALPPKRAGEAGSAGAEPGFLPGFGTDADTPAGHAPLRQPVPAQSPGGGDRPRWPGLAAAAAVIVIVLAAIIAAIGLAPTSTTSHHSAAPARPTGPGHPAALPGHHRLSPATKQPHGSRSPLPGPATPGLPRPGSPAPGVVLPAGFSWYHDPTGFSIGVPHHWRISHQGHLVYLQDPGSSRFLIVDQTTHPKPNPLADWRQQQAARIGTYPGYHRILLRAVNYAQAQRAADWEFTYYSNGQLTRVLNRNILASPHHAYALYWSTPASEWNASYHYFHTFAATFRPA